MHIRDFLMGLAAAPAVGIAASRSAERNLRYQGKIMTVLGPRAPIRDGAHAAA